MRREPLPFRHEPVPWPHAFACQFPEQLPAPTSPEEATAERPYVIWSWACPGCMASFEAYAATHPDETVAPGLTVNTTAASGYEMAPSRHKPHRRG